MLGRVLIKSLRKRGLVSASVPKRSVCCIARIDVMGGFVLPRLSQHEFELRQSFVAHVSSHERNEEDHRDVKRRAIDFVCQPSSKVGTDDETDDYANECGPRPRPSLLPIDPC